MSPSVETPAVISQTVVTQTARSVETPTVISQTVITETARSVETPAVKSQTASLIPLFANKPKDTEEATVRRDQAEEAKETRSATRSQEGQQRKLVEVENAEAANTEDQAKPYDDEYLRIHK